MFHVKHWSAHGVNVLHVKHPSADSTRMFENAIDLKGLVRDAPVDHMLRGLAAAGADIVKMLLLEGNAA